MGIIYYYYTCERAPLELFMLVRWTSSTKLCFMECSVLFDDIQVLRGALSAQKANCCNS